MKSLCLAVAICVLLIAKAGEAYKPVVCMHGFTGTYLEFNQFIEELHRISPDHPVFALNVDNKWASLKRIQTLVDDATKALNDVIAQNQELFRDGFILIGHSQGGIVTRAMLEQNKYNVTKYISLAGVQSGFFGDCGIWFTKNLTCEHVTDLMYTKAMQYTFSAAGYWRTPRREKYLKHNLFLPLLNNEEGTTASPEYQKTQKENFLRVGEYHFFGSPDDEVIKPWYTSLLDTLDTDEESRLSLKDQYIYQHDTFGLRTADEQGRIHFHEVAGVKHEQWIQGRLDILHDYIFPLLD